MTNAGRMVRALEKADYWVASLLFVLGTAAYASLVARLAQGRYYEYYNLAFDFDAARVLSLMTASPPDAFGFKHPLMLMLRPLGQAMLALGFHAKTAAGLIMAGTGGATLALVFLFLRNISIDRPTALALSLLFAVTGTQVMTSMVTETYGFAGLSLVAVWLVAAMRLRSPGQFGILRYVPGIAATGVTVTNVLQPFLAELLVNWRNRGWRSVVPTTFRFGCIFALVFFALVMTLWHSEIIGALRDPATNLKAIWWMQTKGPTTGVWKVIQTFLGFSFVSPVYTVVALPETTNMIDFREWSFAGRGGVVAAAWIVFLIAGTIGGLADASFRPMALAILAALVFNIIFHLGFQFRGSIYIYSAHVHFLGFALATGLAPWMAGNRWLRNGYICAVIALGASVALVNVPIAIGFTGLFDLPDTFCQAPCADGTP